MIYHVLLPNVLGDSEWLLSVPVDGSGDPSTLSMVNLGPLGGGGISFAVSPDSERVVYVETTELTEFPFTESVLFSQPITGGGAVTLHPATFGITFKISRSGEHVVHSVISLTESTKIFSVPTVGGSRIQLNDDNDIPSLFSVGPNSQRVVFTAANQENATQSLQSAPISGGGQTTLATPSENAGISAFAINNDLGSPRVVFVENADLGQSRLASVLITGGGGVEDLSNGFVGGGISPFLFSPDGQRVVFQVIETQMTEGVEQFTAELFSAPVVGLGQGGVPSTFFKGSAVDAAFNFIPSFDSTRLLYGAIDPDDQAGELPGTKELLSADINGGAAQTLVGPLGRQFASDFSSSPSSTVKMFSTWPIRNKTMSSSFIRSPLPGVKPPTKTMRCRPEVTSLPPSPSPPLICNKLVYNADQEQDGLFDLFLVQVGEQPSDDIFRDSFEEK